MIKTKQVPISKIAEVLCLRRGCGRSFKMDQGMPKGWVNIITYWAAHLDPFATVVDVCNSPGIGYDGVWDGRPLRRRATAYRRERSDILYDVQLLGRRGQPVWPRVPRKRRATLSKS